MNGRINRVMFRWMDGLNRDISLDNMFLKNKVK